MTQSSDRVGVLTMSKFEFEATRHDTFEQECCDSLAS
jgi:hypothetical protein